MLISKPSRRYAKAFLDLAEANNCLDRAGSDMAAVGRVIAASPELAALIRNQDLGGSARLRVLEALFSETVHPLTWRFIRFVEYKRRTRLIGEIAASFKEQLDRARGIAAAEIRTAFACAGGELSVISGWLHRHCGKSLDVRHSVDPSLIGGFFARVGDTIFDGSVAGELNELKSQMTRA